MIYPYSQTNRLEEPHKYMYTGFQGTPLLEAYISNRIASADCFVSAASGGEKLDQILMDKALQVLESKFKAISVLAGKKYLEIVGCRDVYKKITSETSGLNDLAIDLSRFTTTESVMSLELLHALIVAQLSNQQSPDTKGWLDRLVQRFEVTKKIYESYPSGFRKGEGGNDSVRLYWLFALALCLFYVETDEIKYLSTLLKVCDLLCSLPESTLQECIPSCGLNVILAAEVVSIQLLAEEKGVSIASK